VSLETTSYDVSIFDKFEEYHGKKVDTYTVRWTVAKKTHRAPFRKYKLADSFRSELITAQNKGEPFDIESGLPLSMKRAKASETTCFKFATNYVDHKWKPASASYRRDIAVVMTLFTTTMLRSEPKTFTDRQMRTALREWAFNTERRDKTPDWAKEILAWVERNSYPANSVSDSEQLSKLLDAANQNLDGKTAAGSVQLRRHAILSNAFEYARITHLLDSNPLERGSGRRAKAHGKGKVKAKAVKAVDKRSLINNDQARHLFASLGNRKPSGARVRLFTRIMYYAGLRPEEVSSLHVRDMKLPKSGWGELTVSEPTPEIGKQWTDSGEIRDHRRQNKGREVGDIRHVPMHPDLVADVRAYIKDNNIKPGDLLLTGVKSGNALAAITVRKNWEAARLEVLGEETVDKETGQKIRLVRTLTGKRIYDLRHTCLTNWLNSGVPPAQVAEWAGNSVPVLLATYVKCISGQEDTYRRRIEETLAAPGTDATAEVGSAGESGEDGDEQAEQVESR